MPGTVVMGVIFVDIKGFLFGEYHATGTNLGSIRFVHGGVARNVAEDLKFTSILVFLCFIKYLILAKTKTITKITKAIIIVFRNINKCHYENIN